LTFLLIPFTTVGDIFRNFSPDIVMRLVLKQSYPLCYACSITVVFYWYLIICLIAWIYTKIKNQNLKK
jgi:hypothetical protein